MPAEDMDYEAFLDFAAKLAAEMGLELDPRRRWTWCAFLVSYSGDGTGYRITRPRGNAKTEVTPIYPPTTYTFPGGSGQIGVSISRGPHAVATDISRRLAPVYRVHLAAIAEHAAGEARLTRQRENLAARIASLFPKVAAPSHCQGNHSTTLIIYGPGHGGGDLRFSGKAEEVEFSRFRVPAETAMKMLAVYAETIQRSQALPGPGPGRLAARGGHDDRRHDRGDRAHLGAAEERGQP